MSIKKLFESQEKSTNYNENTTEKDAFKTVESSKNIKQIKDRQDHFLPKIDYSKPENFAKFGSAYLYYNSAFTRILDYYPYDGSDSEINKFYNGCLNVEKYILDNNYPKSTGYAIFSADGWGSLQGTINGYGVPAALEWIKFYGGPGTGSWQDAAHVSTPSTLNNLSTKSPNKYSDNARHRSNIYDTDIYQTEGLPTGYGKGTRTSNLRANFDDGVTVEFWLKADSPGTVTSTSAKQVLFDWWNNNVPNDAEGDYGRILIEMTSSTCHGGGALNPFVLTVQSGNVTSRNMLALGDTSLHSTHLNGTDWNHYAFKMYNSGSTLKANLYVNGHISDTNEWGSYDLSSSMNTKIISEPTAGAIEYTYTAQESLQGWWRLNGTSYLIDHSGKDRTGTTTNGPAGSNLPAAPALTYVQQTDINKSRLFNSSTTDHINIGTAPTWDAIIGNDTANGSTQMMTFAAWVLKTDDGGDGYGRILDFGDQDIALFSLSTEKLQFTAKWNGSPVHWVTDAAAISEDVWAHVVVTYDATVNDFDPDASASDIAKAYSDPKFYVNGVLQASSKTSGTKTGTFSGIVDQSAYIGNSYNGGAGGRAWGGNLADVAIWNSILTEADIKALYYASDSTWNVKVNNPITELESKNAKGQIGALQYPPAASVINTGLIGGGKLLGSIDDFRYWKAGRSPDEIGSNWFGQVRGGTNTDVSNATLGVYYKFNEGIVGESKTDSIVLDYAGRVTNGYWKGYTSNSRNTGSAILSASAAVKEYEDPIIRTNHPDIATVKQSLLDSGSYHDYNNNGSMLSLMPGWIVDNEEVVTGSDLQNMTHIIGTYFDTLYQQIASVPSLRHLTYTSSSYKPTPFAEHLPQSLGLYAPDMFIDATILEKFMNKDEQRLFRNDLDETKNLIYNNLYNNLTNIFKSKGTEKSIRNVFRCFNVDEKLIRLNVRSDNREFLLNNNLKQTLINKPVLNMSTGSQVEAVVYQKVSPHLPSGSVYATARVVVTGYASMANGETLTLTNAAGRTTTLTVDTSTATSADGIIGISGIGSNADAATKISEAIIATPSLGMTTAIASLTMVDITQSDPGESGNTPITENIGGIYVFGTPDKFSGGTGANETRGYVACNSVPANVSASYGFTAEAGVIFPSYLPHLDPIDRNFATASLFGIQSVNVAKNSSKDGTDPRFTTSTTTSSANYANFQVRALKQLDGYGRATKNIKFQLSQSYVPTGFIFPELTSSAFLNVYDNQHWNLSVRVRPVSSSINAAFMSGAVASTDGASPQYEVIFQGTNTLESESFNSFAVSGTMTAPHGQQFLQTAKRLYVGAERTNITGALLNKSDVRFTNARVWVKSLDNRSLFQHALDMENVGISGSGEHLSPLDPSVSEAQAQSLLNKSTLALDWNFIDITGSDASGGFYTQDFSSGSAELQNNYGWLGTVAAGFQHNGYGYGFAPSSTDPVRREPINSYRFMDPESVVSSDMVNIYDDSDRLFDPFQNIPKFTYSIEKSPYAAITEEILDFFAGAIDFHDVIGAPVNKYRHEYKEMEKLRDSFFRRVTKTSDVEKYLEYYRWFDDALTSIIVQLVPASANFSDHVQNVIESHVLERNKYKHQLPIIKSIDPDLRAFFEGGLYKAWSWEEDSTSVPSSPRPTNIREKYWKLMATASAIEITSGDAAVDYARDIIRKVIRSSPTMTGSTPAILKTDAGATYARKNAQRQSLSKTYVFDAVLSDKAGSGSLKGGTNFEAKSKNFAYAYNAVYPGGPVNRTNNIFVPTNVLVAFTDDMLASKNVVNELRPPGAIDKSKKIFKVNNGRDWQDGIGYANMKSSIAFPFNIVSSSVQTGYNKLVVDRVTGNIEITNLHNDVYGPDKEIPMQGPFTQQVVGGHQSRHVALNDESATKTFYNTGLDNYLTRPEAWKILLGTCGTSPTGAIALVGPDYPWPEANAVNATPYPMTGAQKAWLYRDFIAKRPVNIRNILCTTGSIPSTILGNYRHNYQIVQAGGAHSNPKKFVDAQPNLPASAFVSGSEPTSIRTILSARRDAEEHFNFINDYSVNYLTGTDSNSVIVSRFAAPGGIKVMSRGYQDFRSTEFSVYNALPFRNLSVIKPSQGTSGSAQPPGSTPSEARVYDIHAKDFGLRSHLGRHTARFGRDSLNVTGTTFATNGPGASYNQLPGFHKVHRNNRRRMKVCDVSLIPVFSGCATTNTSGAYFTANTNDTVMVNTSSATATSFLTSSRANNGLAFAGWIRFTPTTESTDDVNIWGIGRSANSDQLFLLQKNKTAPAGSGDCAGSGSGNSLGFKLSTRSTPSPSGGGTRRSVEYRAYTDDINDGAFHHIALVLSGTNGSLSSTLSCSFYIDGVKQFTCRNDTNTIQNYFDQKLESYGTSGFMSWKAGDTFNFSNTATPAYAGDEFLVIGGNGHTNIGQTNNFSGSMDQLTFWVKPLTDANITELYNSGVPCDVTCSSVHTSDTAALHIWLPLGEGHSTTAGTAYYDTAASSNGTAFNSSSNALWDMSGKQNNFWTVSKEGNSSNDLVLSNGTGYTPSSVLAGCTAPLSHIYERKTYCTSSVYDNFNVQHAIPRTDLQYMWLSRSIANPHDIRYNSYQRSTNTTTENVGFYSTSNGYLPFFTFVSGSDVGNNSSLGGGMQPTNRLNTITLDAFSSSTNTVGFTTSATGSDYINASLNTTNDISNASVLNLLLARRGDKYGWTWRSTRRFDSLVSVNSYKNKTISAITGSDLEMHTFRLPPVSVRGRPVLINFDAPIAAADAPQNNTKYNSVSLKTTHNNEKIHFNEYALNEFAEIRPGQLTTPFNQLIGISNNIPGYKLNWILYSQNVFPSMRNEFFTGTTSRTNFDNKFWRDDRADRTIDLWGTDGSKWTYNSIRADYAVLSEWPLDAPSDFLTRTAPAKITNETSYYNLRRLNTAGELQSTYYSYFTGSMDTKTGATYDTYINGGAFKSNDTMIFDIMDQLTVSGLYSRKHMNAARYSAATPCAVRMNGTGGYGQFPDTLTANRGRTAADTNAFKTGSAFFPIQTYAGEALWEAGTDAGVWEYSQSIEANSTSSVFVSQSSAPWRFDTYTDYIEDLNLVARGYSIIPEFRISDHVEEYARYGISNKGQLNAFEIVGTGINSTTASFYKDYSNSEFMKDFLQVRADSLLGAKEIRIACSAAIRYNPYKGFYPAQRTLDLTGRFMNSYLSYLNTTFMEDGKTVTDANLSPYIDGGNFAPMWRTLFAPGILYNSIKSGIAVDYPIVLDPLKIGRKTDFAGMDQACGLYPLTNTSGTNKVYGYKGGTYFDKRLPFETMVNPNDHLDGLSFYDLESHLSMSLPVTCSWTNAGGDIGLYPMMASNFFGEVGNFFLKDSTFTKLESNVVANDLQFKGGEVYGARLRIMGSSDGSRIYKRERDARTKDMSVNLDSAGSGAYAQFGARCFTASSPSTNPYQGGYVAFSGAYFPIPQDPKNTAFYEFKKNFVMYSRPTAFGPPISGRSHTSDAMALTASRHGCYDSFEGYNWAFTPPYTNGEAWADLVFRPSASVAYDLEKILAETQVVYWRADPGAPSGSGYSTHMTNLIYGGPGTDIASDNPIYGGPNLNSNAMQLSASFNLFGVERVFKMTKDKFGNEIAQTNEPVGKKWIIQPKFETPMMNFTDEDTQYASSPSLRPISTTAGTLTLPIYGSASVPRGMWHQFGTMPTDPDKGVFIDIGPIPPQWLKYHYRVLNTGSLYNNYDTGSSRKDLFNNMKSLTDIASFQKTGQQKRLGEIKEKAEIYEAIVAIPYVLENLTTPSAVQPQMVKKFINIPKKRYNAAVAIPGSKKADSLTTAGASIRSLLQKMDRYILPPQLDFKNNTKVSPFVMYIFEFKYEFDQDDLSYIWQNLAPRDSKKMTLQNTSVAHELMDTELLNEDNLLTNPNLRWMVFKVKQRSNSEYYDLIPDQAAQATKEIVGSKKTKEGYELQYNWPYDYLSFVELVKMDVEVLYRTEDLMPDSQASKILPDLKETQKRTKNKKQKSRERARAPRSRTPNSADIRVNRNSRNSDNEGNEGGNY